MKKIIIFGLLAAVVAVAAFFIFKRPGAHQTRAAQLVPAGTVFFAQILDARESGERWKKTALAQLWNEPEMQAFLEKPRTQAPFFKDVQVILDRLERISPQEAFVAVTSIDDAMPHLLAGFSYRGNEKEAEAFVAEWRAQLLETRPAGKRDIVSHAGREIQTFTDKELTVAECFHEGQYLVANNLELLQQTIDRQEGKGGAGGALGDTELFKRALEPLPARPDAVVFAHVGVVMERALDLLAASGQKLDAEQIAEMKKVQALSACTKMEGRNFRDTIFVLRPDSAPQARLARSSLALTSAQTLLYYVTALPEKLDVDPATLGMASLFLPAIGQVQTVLAEQGLTVNDLGTTFGPELSVIMDWPEGAPQPDPVVVLDIRDAVKARSFLEVLASGKLGSPAWVKQEQDGATIYTMPGEGAAAALAMTDRFFTFGLSSEAVAAALARIKGGGEQLDKTGGYSSAAKLVREPTSGFSYIDLAGLAARSYGTLRPLLVMTLALSPEAGQSIDAGKLPSLETLTKHLGPIAYSQSETGKGTLIETAGPVTLNQLAAVIVAGAVGAAAPMLQQLGAEGLDPNKLFQMMPGAGDPGTPGLDLLPPFPGLTPPAVPDADSPAPDAPESPDAAPPSRDAAPEQPGQPPKIESPAPDIEAPAAPAPPAPAPPSVETEPAAPPPPTEGQNGPISPAPASEPVLAEPESA